MPLDMRSIVSSGYMHASIALNRDHLEGDTASVTGVRECLEQNSILTEARLNNDSTDIISVL